jgi:hypothetical protein
MCRIELQISDCRIVVLRIRIRLIEVPGFRDVVCGRKLVAMRIQAVVG